MSVKNVGKESAAKQKRNKRHQAIIALIRSDAKISQVKLLEKASHEPPEDHSTRNMALESCQATQIALIQ